MAQAQEVVRSGGHGKLDLARSTRGRRRAPPERIGRASPVSGFERFRQGCRVADGRLGGIPRGLALASFAATAQETCPAVPVLAASDAVEWLDDQEGGPHRGHTIARHVGKTVTWLRQRLRREPTIPAASSFRDKLSAARVVRAVMRARANCGRLMRWIRGGGRRLELTGRFARAIGTSVVRRTGRAFSVHRATVVLQRAGRGYAVLTAYPMR